MKDFWKGVISGAGVILAVVLVVVAIRFFQEKDRVLNEIKEQEHEIQILREDYGARDPREFLDGVPGVRGAVDSATEEFNRKRDAAIQRIRGGLADR
ncbi:hypothetical protein AGMMS4952_03460 [Spirochaetia bacterium]|nr:hypothetical protein AGMMS4952_03460 [Spirochaetia bacterium]